MKISPYIKFKGNCSDAIEFYKNIFGVDAKMLRYKDMPSSQNLENRNQDIENLVMHAHIEVNGEKIMMCDVLPEDDSLNVGNNIFIMLEFDNVDLAKEAFESMKIGGKVEMEFQKTFWGKYFGCVTDKFGVTWNISII